MHFEYHITLGGPLTFVWESLEKRKRSTCCFFYQNKSFFFLSFFSVISPLLECIYTHVPPQKLGLCKKFMCLVQSEKAMTVTTVMSSAIAHILWVISTMITCCVDCKETSCWMSPLAAACHFQVLSVWQGTGACKLLAQQGWLQYTLHYFPTTDGPSAE